MAEPNVAASEPDNNPLPPAIRGIRAQEALARFAGDVQRYQHWLAEFTSHAPAVTTQVRDAISKGTREAALGLVHSLKGRAGMLGMVEIHSIALSLEMSLKNREPTAFWLDELERTVDEMSRDIATALDKSEN